MPLMRGAIPTSRAKLLRTQPFLARGPLAPFVAYVPKKISAWGNDQYGVCVTTEEAFAKACAQPEIFIETSEVIRWAERHGWLNGAELTPVMREMARAGFSQSGHTYGDGPYRGVDFSDEELLKNALMIGPVKIGIDADALPSGAGNVSGWHALGSGRHYRNEDHCVPLAGYGTAAQLYAALGLALPHELRPDQPGYLLFTWNTIGFVDHAWIMSTCGEAFVRDPSTTIDGVPVPNPGPDPTPPPPPPVPPVPSGLPTQAQWDELSKLIRPQLFIPTQVQWDALSKLVRPQLPGSAKAVAEAGAIDWRQLILTVLTLLISLLQPQTQGDHAGR